MELEKSKPGMPAKIQNAINLMIEALRAFDTDNNLNGGLISRETIRKFDELRQGLMVLGWSGE